MHIHYVWVIFQNICRRCRYVNDFSVDYKSINVEDIIEINKYLVKKHHINKCLDLSKKYLLDF